MSYEAKITSKGQITIPKDIRARLNTDVVEFEVKNGEILLRPVRSVSGSLSSFAKGYIPLDRIRDQVWQEGSDVQ